MRRITLIVVSTLSVLVLLFSYRTSLGDSGSTAAQAVSTPRVIAGSSGATTTGQGPDPAAGDDQPSRVTQPTSSPTAAPTNSAPTSSQAGSTAAVSPVPSTADPAGLTATVDGAAEMTRFGAVQVEVQITAGKITDVVALQYPQQERRDLEINQVAIPELHDQVIAAQSTKVDGVSGATYTTDGYLSSLQSALDAAGFGS